MPMTTCRSSASTGRGIARKGAVLVIFAASLMTFISFMALVIDVGYLYALKARIQGVCDATALATLSALDSRRPAASQERFARGLSRKLLQINGLDLKNYSIQLESATAGGPPARIRIAGREELNAFFAQAIGRPNFVVGVYAQAAAVAAPDGHFEAHLEE